MKTIDTTLQTVTDTKTFNLIDALNCFYREDVITDMLATLINHSNHFAAEFVHQFGSIQLDGNKHNAYDFEARTRIGLGKNIGVPDLIVTVREDNEIRYMIVLENKLGADEGMKQTERYAQDNAKEQLCKRLGVEVSDVIMDYVYLTLDPFTKPGSAIFRKFDYRVFLTNNWSNIIREASLNQLFNDFREKLEVFYAPLSSKIQEQVIILLANPDLDELQRRLMFTEFIQEINTSSVHLQKTETLNAQGRSMVLALFGKEDWIGENYKQTKELSGNCFNIHFECVLDLLNPLRLNGEIAFSMAIHYETNPYLPESKRKNLPGHEEHLRVRNLVKKHVHHLIDQEGSLSPNTNVRKTHTKNAIFQVTFKEVHTFMDLKVLLEETFRVFTPIIDRAIGDVIN